MSAVGIIFILNESDYYIFCSELQFVRAEGEMFMSKLEPDNEK